MISLKDVDLRTVDSRLATKMRKLNFVFRQRRLHLVRIGGSDFDPGVLIQDIERLGFFHRELECMRQMITSNTGLVLVVGPTGSGKTTTLYSSLHYIASPRINVITLEDPIEMVHEKFNQIAMRPKIGLTFGSALKTVLRQDPDVVMVGEIRDEDTASNVVQVGHDRSLGDFNNPHGRSGGCRIKNVGLGCHAILAIRGRSRCGSSALGTESLSILCCR